MHKQIQTIPTIYNHMSSNGYKSNSQIDTKTVEKNKINNYIYRERMYPIIRVSSDNIHVHSNERKDLARFSSWVFYNKVPSFGDIGDMVDDQRAAASGGAEGEEGVEHVLDDSVLLRDQLRWVILHEFRFPYQLRQKGHK